MSVEMPFQLINLHEGMTVSFKDDHPITLLAMFGLMAFTSAAFECRPVVCREFLPKLDVQLSLSSPLINDETALNYAWDKIQTMLLAWLDQTPTESSGRLSYAGFNLILFQTACPHEGVVTFTRSWKPNRKKMFYF